MGSAKCRRNNLISNSSFTIHRPQQFHLGSIPRLGLTPVGRSLNPIHQEHDADNGRGPPSWENYLNRDFGSMVARAQGKIMPPRHAC